MVVYKAKWKIGFFLWKVVFFFFNKNKNWTPSIILLSVLQGSSEVMLRKKGRANFGYFFFDSE